MTEDFDENELRATLAGGKMGGQYLDSIGVYDLRNLSKEQWQQFLICIVGNYRLNLTNRDPVDGQH